MRSSNIMRNISTAILVLMILGCATSSSVAPSNNLPPENGLVIMKMSSNNRLDAGPRYFSVLVVDQVDSSAISTYEIVRSTRGMTNSSIYFGSLPAGRYKPVRMMSSGLNSSSWMSFRPGFGTFTVEAGRVTDLGHVLIDFYYTNEVGLERGQTANDWLPAYTERYFPNIPQSVFSQDYLAWDQSVDSDGGEQTRYASMRMTSKGFLNPTILSDGSVLLGSLLGPVKHWMPGGTFRYLDAGNQGSVDATAEIAKGVWLAGGENGQVRVTSDAGKTWRDYGSRFVGRSVVGLNLSEGRVYATVLSSTDIAIYVSLADTTEWQMVTSQPVEYPSWSNSQQLVRSHLQGDHLFTTLPMKSLLVTDLTTHKATVRDLPGKLFEFTVGRDGNARCRCGKGLGFAGYVSDNLGETWTIEPAKIQSLAYFIDNNTGYTVQGKVVLKTEDGGENWTTVSELSTNSIELAYIEKTSTLIATNRFDMLVFSDDGGKTWRTR